MRHTQDKFTVEHKNRQEFYLRILYGVKEIIRHKWKIVFPTLYLLVLSTITAISYRLCNQQNTFLYLWQIVKILLPVMFIVLALLGIAQILVTLGTPLNAKGIQHKLFRIGLKNSVGETPILLSKRKEKKYIIMEFYNCGISLEEWEKNRERISSILPCHIEKIIAGVKPNYTLLYTLSAKYNLPSHITWDKKYVSQNNSVFTLGKGMLDIITFDIAENPQVLIAGTSGSGKTTLLKLLLAQAVMKTYEVIIGDFKGGVDYPLIWHTKCQIIFDENSLHEVLSYMIKTLKERQILFNKSQCRDLNTYNLQTGNNLPRIIFGCDEISEILTKGKNMSKEQKDLIDTIENQLVTIARQGRAFGLHLILAIHRPDSTLVSGQLKSALMYRICGKADSILADIVLDNVTAATHTFEKGRFVNSEAEVFQAFWFDEENWN